MKKQPLNDSPPENDVAPSIVQFIHPGREYIVRGPCPANVPWIGGSCGSGCSGHFRRLIVHDGEFVDDSGSLQKARLAFWGEWGAETVAEEMPPDEKGKMCARWVHTIKSPLVELPKTQNTDPCVFGSTFKYCCCRQRPYGEMRRLAPESIILFGSHISDRFWLDTVFVVAEVGKPYRTDNGSSIDSLRVSREYRSLTLDRLNSGVFSFYRGTTFPGATRGGIYSFVPSRRFNAKNPECGERFELDLDALNSTLPRGCKRLARNLNQNFKKITIPKQNIYDIWNEVLRQVKKAGFVPAVHFNWPK